MSASSVADDIKARGNKCFAMGKLDAAIEAYSECICLEPKSAVYYTNRALCYHKKHAWEKARAHARRIERHASERRAGAQVASDCSAAIAIDDRSIKGFYLLGAALVEQGDYDGGIPKLDRALALCREQTVSYRDDIRRAMFSARKRQWRQRLPLRLEHIRMSEALIASLDDGMDVDDGGGAGAGGAAGCLREALELLRERHTPTSVPDRFCCKISMDVMMDPVVTPSGVTYERSSLREHLRRVGQFDPLTREPLSIDQVFPNLALREAIEEYLEHHPWAYESDI